MRLDKSLTCVDQTWWNLHGKDGILGNALLHEVAKVLVDYGEDLNMKNNDGDTPLAVAQKSGNNAKEVTAFLKEVSSGKYKPGVNKLPDQS